MSNIQHYNIYLTGTRERLEMKSWDNVKNGITANLIPEYHMKETVWNAIRVIKAPSFVEVEPVDGVTKEYTLIKHGDDNNIDLSVIIGKLKASIAALGNTNNNNMLEVIKRKLELAISKVYVMRWTQKLLGDDVTSIHFSALEDATVGMDYHIEDLCFMLSNGTELKWWEWCSSGVESDEYKFGKIDDMGEDEELMRHIGNIDYWTPFREYEDGMIVIRKSHLLSEYEEL